MANDKFKALVHLIVASCSDPRRLGATRLNKICWYSDTAWYRAFGVPMTGETYVRRAKGPVPKSILRVLRELEAEGKILVRQDDHPVYRTRLFYSLAEPDKSAFSAEEIGTIAVISKDICENHTAGSISDLTHDDVWSAASEGEEIPLYATLVSRPGEVTAEVTAWADSVLGLVCANQTDGRSGVAA